MKILIVSEYIAPVKSIAAIRWTKLGKYLSKDHGCEVDILTNEKSFDPSNLTTALYEKDEALAEDLAYFNKVYTFSDGLGIKLLNIAINGAKAAYRLMVGRGKKKAKKQIEAANATAHESVPEKEDAKSGGGSKGADSKKPNNALPSLGGASFIANAYDHYMDIRSSLLSRRAHTSGVNWDGYDVVISTYGPKWPHMMVNRQKKKGLDAIWLADYRDTVVLSTRNATKANKEFPTKQSCSADLVLAINEPLLNALRLPKGQNRIALSNGFDPSDIESSSPSKKSNKFKIAYTGALYNDRESYSDITPIFKALSELISESRIDANDIEFVYCGTSSAQFAQQIASYPLVPHIDLGSVPRTEALSIQGGASLLVLCVWNTANNQGMITGKVFEYLFSGTPIVATCTGDIPDSACAEILYRSGAGFCYEEVRDEEHFKKLTEFIAEKYEQWKEASRTSYVPNEEYIDSFRYDRLADELYSVIESLQG